MLGHRAVEVLGDAAAGDVRHRVDRRTGLERADEPARVDGGGAQHGVGERLAAQLLERGLELLDGLALDGDLAHERVAVGVDAARRQAEDDVALAHELGADHLGTVDDAHHEAGEVVVVRRHDAGVLGHLAAHQRAAAHAAAVGDTRDDRGDRFGLELADCHVIEEEQRLGAHDHDVVDAHGNEVLANGAVAVEQLGDRKLGAHAVGARDEHGVFHVLEARHREARSESAEPADDLGSVRARHGGLDGIHGAGAFGGINAGVLVGHVLGGVVLGHGGPPSGFVRQAP